MFFFSESQWHTNVALHISLQREMVGQLLQEPNSSYSVICDNLKKVYPGKDGNSKKIAVRELSLSMARGQCFGVLGPNGAGKTTLINMVGMNFIDTIIYYRATFIKI